MTHLLVRSARRSTAPALALAALLACNRSSSNVIQLPADNPGGSGKRDDPPVALNAESPVEYPPALFEQGIEGKVVLRLYVDEKGTVVSDSTRVAESSGYPALDSAAVEAAPKLEFAPALRNGTPVAAPFLQPIHFRHPRSGGARP